MSQQILNSKKLRYIKLPIFIGVVYVIKYSKSESKFDHPSLYVKVVKKQKTLETKIISLLKS